MTTNESVAIAIFEARPGMRRSHERRLTTTATVVDDCHGGNRAGGLSLSVRCYKMW